MTAARTPFADLPPPTQAGIMCNDSQFQTFVGVRTLGHAVQVQSSAAAEYLRDICRISSRRELETDAKAERRFQMLRTEFDAWCGRIARPRDG